MTRFSIASIALTACACGGKVGTTGEVTGTGGFTFAITQSIGGSVNSETGGRSYRIVPAAGGSIDTGGTRSVGGGLGTGGAFATGGYPGSGGSPSTGGRNPTGGSYGYTGGSPSTGGHSIATGGMTNIGGSIGGSSVATGGASSTGFITGGVQSIGGTNSIGGSNLTSTGGNSQVPTGGSSAINFGCTRTTLTDVNVYVIKDASPSGADTEGNMYVGGNLVPSVAGYSVGAKDVVDCTVYSLVGGGNVSNVVVKGGRAIVGGTIANSTDQDCGGVTRGSVPVDFATLESQVETLSIGLSELASNCTVAHDAAGALVLTATDPVQSVCNIDASQLGNVDVNFPVGASVVVNVTGTSITWSGLVCLNGQCADSAQADFVVWNMYEATAIAPTGIAIEGSLLAPLATLTGSGGHISGQVIVEYINGGLEYHPYYFAGCVSI